MTATMAKTIPPTPENPDSALSAPDASTNGGAQTPDAGKVAPVDPPGSAGVAVSKPDKRRSGIYTGPPIPCQYCDKPCKNPGGKARHEKHCKARPSASGKVVPPTPPPPPEPPKKLDDFLSETAADGAARAASLIDDVSGAGGGVVETIARMDAAEVGVPDLIALVCLRALPPPLTDAEYASLRMAWRDNKVAIPPWLMTLLVTLAVLGPRAVMHPVVGPWLREKLIGPSEKAAQAAAGGPFDFTQTSEPIVTPPPKPEPPPPASKPGQEARDKIRAAMETH
jgi:hypothetical protein